VTEYERLPGWYWPVVLVFWLWAMATAGTAGYGYNGPGAMDRALSVDRVVYRLPPRWQLRANGALPGGVFVCGAVGLLVEVRRAQNAAQDADGLGGV
jgi:hypothetical protein